MKFLFDLGGIFFDWAPKYFYQSIFSTKKEMDYFLTNICNNEWNIKQDKGRLIKEAEIELINQFPNYTKEIKMYYANHRKMIKRTFQSSIDMLFELKSRKYLCYVLSNWSAETFIGMEEAYPFLKKFDDMLISGNVKLIKPDKKIYQLAINKFNLDPSINGPLLCAMGIDIKSKKIKKEGPVGYNTRNIVIESTVNFLRKINKQISTSEVSSIFIAVDDLQQKYQDYNVEIINGVKSCFKSLKNKGLFLSVYTSDRYINAEMILKKLCLDEFIDVIIGGDDVTEGKPDPEGFLKACNELDVKPNNSAYVGDTVSDMIMGKNGGAAMVVGLETGLFTSSELQKNTEYIYPSMIEFNVGIQQYL